MNDRLTLGFLSGMIAHFFQAISSITFYTLKVSELRFQDFSAILVLGHRPMNGMESIFAEVVAMFFSASLGVLFTYLIPEITSKYYLFKGWLFAVVCWSVIYAIVILFKVPGLNVISPLTTFINVIGSSIYGLSLAIASRKISYLIPLNSTNKEDN